MSKLGELDSTENILPIDFSRSKYVSYCFALLLGVPVVANTNELTSEERLHAGRVLAEEGRTGSYWKNLNPLEKKVLANAMLDAMQISYPEVAEQFLSSYRRNGEFGYANQIVRNVNGSMRIWVASAAGFADIDLPQNTETSPSLGLNILSYTTHPALERSMFSVNERKLVELYPWLFARIVVES